MYNTQLPKYESEKNLSYFGPIRDQMFPILAGQGCYNSLSGLSSLDHILKINFYFKVFYIKLAGQGCYNSSLWAKQWK